MTQTAIYRVEFTGLDAAGAATVFRYATKGYSSPPAAPVANTWMDGRLSQPLLFRRDMYGENRTHGDVQIAHGQMVLENSDGGLDTLANYAFDAQRVKLYRVDSSNLTTETVVFTGYTEQVTFSMEQVTFTVRDELYALSRSLQTTKYAGTNSGGSGVEGTAADLIGKPKPFMMGWPKNITPIPVNTSKLIYQISHRQITSVSVHAFDMRTELNRGGDYTSQADMEANAPAAFTYRVWPTGGMLRLGSSPAGRLTVDYRETKTWTAVLIQILNQVFGNAANYVLDTDRLVSVSAANNVGVFWSEEIASIDAVRELLATINATIQTYTATLGGGVPVLTVTRLVVPSAGSSVLALDTSNILGVKNIDPADDERGIPPWRIRINYARNYTVMGSDEVSGSASSFDQSYAGMPFLTAMSDNASLKTQYPNSPELEVQTSHLQRVDVVSVADGGSSNNNQLPYLVALYSGAKRRLFSVRIAMEVFEGVTSTTATSGTVQGLVLGHHVVVTWPRFNLNAGVAMQVLGYVLDYQAQEVELVLWGILP